MTIEFKFKGKVDNKTANKLLNNMLLVGLACKDELNTILEKHDIRTLPVYSAIYHRLRNRAEFDMQYDDSHPAFSPWENIEGKMEPPRKRLVPFCNWSMANDYYGKGCNDSHWATVQKQVQKQFTEELLKLIK